ncbi:hypothetical protein VTO42DRAFT_2518 [Malbranchea cinnamomea]
MASTQSDSTRPVVPVLSLRGSPYEIGFQHGKQAKPQIDSNIRTYAAFFQETAGLTWAEAKQKSTIFIPTLERLYPEILEEIQGIADGARLDRDDILALNVRSEISLTNYEDAPGKGPPAITDGCTGLAQLSKDGSKLILAQNWDWIPDLEHGMVVLDITTNAGTRLQFMNEAGLVGKIGLNSHGFGLCNNALKCGALATDRLPTHIMSRRLLQYAKSYEEGVQLLSDYGGACATNYILADATGKFGDVEVTPRGNVIVNALPPSSPDANRETGQGPSFVAHTNHIVSPPTSFPLAPIYDRPAPNSFSRITRMSDLTMNDIKNDVPLTTESVMERLKDRQGAPYSICRDSPADATGMERMQTLASIVMEFDVVHGTAKGILTLGKPVDKGLQRVDLVF